MTRIATAIGLLLLCAAPTAAQNQRLASGAGSSTRAPIDTLHRVSPAMAREYAGTYRIAPGHEITLGPFDRELDGRLSLLDLATRETRVLWEQNDSVFAMGTTMAGTDRVQATLTFSRDAGGRVRGLRWRPAGGAETFAPIAYPTRRENVEFRSGDVVLRGVLSIPAGAGRHPAVVLANGSGPVTRYVGPFNTVFERMGIAVLSFDKRGTGESTGDLDTAGLSDLADDVLAGIAMLRARPDIDGGRVGVYGTSEGGWVGSLAASRSPHVAWLHVRVGSGVSVLETVAHEYRHRFLAEGYTPAQADSAVEFLRAVQTMVMNGASWEATQAFAAPHEQHAWYRKRYPNGRAHNADIWTWWRKNGAVDATEALRTVRVPVDWYLGRDDHNVPSATTHTRVAEALAAAGNGDFAIHVLPSDHGFLEAGADGAYDFPRATRYVAGYWESMETWLRARGFTGPAPASTSR